MKLIAWFLSRLPAWLQPASIPKTRSRERDEPLTPWERAFITAHRNQKCPDCERGQLYFIAEACGMMNVYCGHCDAKFNISEDVPCVGERMAIGVTNPDPQFYRG